MPRLPNLKALRLFVRYWKLYPRLSLLNFLFSMVLAVQVTAPPLLIAIVLGQLIRTHIVNVALLLFAGVFQAVILIIGYVLNSKVNEPLNSNIEKTLYEDTFVYLVHQDYSFFTNRFSGSIVTQASRFVKAYETFHDTVFFDLLPQLYTLLFAVGVMTYYSPPLGMAVLIMWLLSMGIIIRFALGRLPLRRGAVAKESEQIGELADVINNSLTVKTFGSEDREIRRYQKLNLSRHRLLDRSWQRAVRNIWIVNALCAVLQMVVFVGGILAVHQGSLGIAQFLLFQVYILRIINNIYESNLIFRQLEAVSGDAEEMAELLEQAPLVQDREVTEFSRIADGAIAFAEVTFRYQDNGASTEQLFENFSLEIKPGEKIGLVGPSGGGKTTITRLLLRFMDIQDGSIRIDGQDIRDIKQQDLRRAIAYVPQEPLLFHRSIKDNIRYGKPSATDEEVIAVAKKSFAHDFIKTLPEGYDTLVGERGVKLSGGQRQRVAIARAMLKNAPILVLDEATSALDSESERVIQKALWELMKDKTAVVIAHRLSTIQRMDRIVVLDKGWIIEQGTHGALLQEDGLYAKLWHHQSGGFIEE
jgi:ATP-binding cassette, subfamily B, bacterial